MSKEAEKRWECFDTLRDEMASLACSILELEEESRSDGFHRDRLVGLYDLADSVFGATNIKRLIDALNAKTNREAQPVAVPEYLTYLRDPIISNVLADDDNSPMANAARILAREVKFWRSQPLFIAPLSPAEPDERHAFESFVAQQFGEAVDRRRAKNGDNEYMAWDMAVAWIVWQRRAAMLAQPVSQGYTLNSPEIPDGWKMVPNEPTTKQWAAGLKAMDGGIDKVTLAYRAMVEVAPPPGGSDDSHTTAT